MVPTAIRPSPKQSEDWFAIAKQLADGDRLAFLKINRLVSAFLRRLRAYDFEHEWDDLRQEVVMAIVDAVRQGRLRDTDAILGYARAVTRNKFADRLKRRMRYHENETISWTEIADRHLKLFANPGIDDELRQELWGAVSNLPTKQQRILVGLYREGKTYQQASDDLEIPLGTLKRELRNALILLRRRFSEAEAIV